MSKQLATLQIKEAGELNKTQKQFNAAIRKIEKIKQEVANFDESVLFISEQVQKKIMPLELTFLEEKYELMLFIHKKYLEIPKRQKARIRKIKYLLTNWVEGFLEIEQYYDKVLPIYNQLNDTSFEEEQIEEEKEQVEKFRTLMRVIHGIEREDEFWYDCSMEELLEKVRGIIFEQVEEEELAKKNRKEGKKASKKDTKKSEKEQQKAEQEKNNAQTVRKIYMELVKEYHPDGELDEAEKERKSDIMKKITDAYQRKDLFELLRLQAEYLQLQQAKKEALAEEKLQVFVKMLHKQIAEMEEELFLKRYALQQERPSYWQYYHQSNEMILRNINKGCSEWEKKTKEIRGVSKKLQEDSYFKEWVDGIEDDN